MSEALLQMVRTIHTTQVASHERRTLNLGGVAGGEQLESSLLRSNNGIKNKMRKMGVTIAFLPSSSSTVRTRSHRITIKTPDLVASELCLLL